MTDLTTTNIFLGIMAFVSLLEALTLVGAAAAVFLIYRRSMRLLNEVEGRHVAPAAAKVNAILDDVRVVTGAARMGTTRIENAVGGVIAAIGRRWAARRRAA